MKQAHFVLLVLFSCGIQCLAIKEEQAFCHFETDDTILKLTCETPWDLHQCILNRLGQKIRYIYIPPQKEVMLTGVAANSSEILIGRTPPDRHRFTQDQRVCDFHFNNFSVKGKKVRFVSPS